MRFPSPGNATWPEIGRVILVLVGGLTAIWLALAFHTGGF